MPKARDIRHWAFISFRLTWPDGESSCRFATRPPAGPPCDEAADADGIDPEDITRRSDQLMGEFRPSLVRQTRRELERIVTNWRTQPAFPPPRFDVPEYTAPAQPAT